MMTSRTRFWLCAAGIAVLVALTWLAPVTSVSSQELKPLFDASECAPVLDGYVDDGHSAAPGAIICKYNKAPAGDPPPGERARENWNSLWLFYYPSDEEATAWIQDELSHR